MDESGSPLSAPGILPVTIFRPYPNIGLWEWDGDIVFAESIINPKADITFYALNTKHFIAMEKQSKLQSVIPKIGEMHIGL